MKILIKILWVCGLGIYHAHGASTREEDAKAMLPKFREQINAASQLPPEQAIPIYGNTLEILGRWSSYPIEEKWPVFHEAQQKLLSIPGHATYYRDKINALREQLLEGNLGLEDWGDKKSLYFKVLGHLPSEEAVEVLCGFAGDDFATGGFLDSKNAHIPGLKDWKFTDYAVDFTVCLPAMTALHSLQIENGPSVEGIDAEKHALVWRQWWQEVKTGKRKYRFKGSSVEHPINAPPGAGREVRRPERRPESRDGADTGENRQSSAGESSQEKKEPSHWLWIAGITSILLAVLAYFLKGRILRS
jgi:hypothetical protein